MPLEKTSKVTQEASSFLSDQITERYKEIATLTLIEDELQVTGDIKSMAAFHAERVYMVEADDDYLFDMRANHFVIEEGWSETLWVDDESFNFDLIPCFLVTANHKGTRKQKLYVEKPER